MILKTYLFSALLLCFCCICIGISNRKTTSFFQKKYWKFLFQKWKIFTFISATLALTIIAPYMNDPTWDYVDMPIMALLTFLTAPWVIGILYRIFKKTASFGELLLAILLWMLSVSWSYDLYILWRDGIYPLTWFSNIPASSMLYFLAGLFWNIEWNTKLGLIFSFLKKDWFHAEQAPFKKIAWFLMFLGALVLFLLLYGANIE